MLKEFKEFIMRGNVLDLAVAVIIGGAFSLIVGSFINDVLMPPIGMALGGVDFSNLAFTLKEAGVDADGNAVEAVAVRWGAFVNTVVNFLIIAASIFLIVKVANSAKKEEPAPEPAPAGPTQEELLAEIRDLLKKS